MTKESGESSKKETSIPSTPQFQCPMLKPSNYSLWAIRMQIILEANGLWEMIEPSETTKSDNKKDKTAIAFLYQSLPEEQLLQITKHKTAKAIWNALKTRHLGEERVQQARLQTLKSDFEMLQMMEDETIDAFTTKLTTLVNKAASLGHTMEDETLVRKLLNAVPDRNGRKFHSTSTYQYQYNRSGRESLDGGIPKAMNSTWKSRKIYTARKKTPPNLKVDITDKDDQPGLRKITTMEGGNNQKHDHMDTMRSKATKVEIPEEGRCIPGYKNESQATTGNPTRNQMNKVPKHGAYLRLQHQIEVW
ncbi:zinc finger, CCHC-type containing protein [Tanacetum coccineum]